MADALGAMFEHFLHADGQEVNLVIGPGPGSPTVGNLDRTVSEAAVEFFGEQCKAWLASRIIRSNEAHGVMPKGAKVTLRVELDTDSMLDPEHSKP